MIHIKTEEVITTLVLFDFFIIENNLFYSIMSNVSQYSLTDKDSLNVF